MSYPRLPRELSPAVVLGELLLLAATDLGRWSSKAFQIRRRKRSATTLRPGKKTPLWNELRAQLQPHLAKYGHQANLGRVLGLPRQRINAFVTGGSEMPDAERTLQMLVWLLAVRRGRRPS